MESILNNELLYKGSTKDIYYLSSEELIFSFSDRYSVFDYGEMPNLIEGKGESTVNLTKYLYNYLSSELNIKTHLVKNGQNSKELIVKKFDVPRDFDHSVFYKKKPINAFVPLEVIFRFGVPQGSSLLNRGAYLVNEKFKEPLIEFTSKLESIDRLLTEFEASEIASLSNDELTKLKALTSNIAYKLKEKIESKGFLLWDGKLEFAFIQNENDSTRDFILVDSISLDELRVTYNDFPLSKEILRQIYKHSDWYKRLNELKSQDNIGFRQHISVPESLDQSIMDKVSLIYHLTQNAISSDDFQIEDLLKVIGELKNEYPHYWSWRKRACSCC